MSTALKPKKSPRAPSMSLDEAMNRVGKLYRAEGRHAAPIEVALKHIGYSSKNGAALTAIASLGYWGLVERPADGMIAVSKVFEEYEFNPDAKAKDAILVSLLRTPTLFADMLDRYGDRLPSDGTIKFDLIKQGFHPPSAANIVVVLKKSVEYSRYLEQRSLSVKEVDATSASTVETDIDVDSDERDTPSTHNTEPKGSPEVPDRTKSTYSDSSNQHAASPDVDRIPVRLPGGRRAWIEIPTPFYSADKERLKAQIDLLLTVEDEADDFGPEDD